MHVKIINPATDGQKVFANTGSARRATNYLEQEARSDGQEASFFSREGLPIQDADEVVRQLDNNHKGLRQESAKFYSLVLSPDQQELAELGSAKEELMRYTRHVMSLYAQNFHLKNGRSVSEADLVWAATIHQERKYRGNNGEEQGESKPGLQTHVHILVSARDAQQQLTLNPLGALSRFNRVEFYAQACTHLEDQLGHPVTRQVGAVPASWEQRIADKAADIHRQAAANRQQLPLTPAQLAAKEARLDRQLVRLNDKAHALHQLDPVKVKDIGRSSNYGTDFYHRLRQLERKLERGQYQAEPYVFLRQGRVDLPLPLAMSLSRGPAPRYQATLLPAAKQHAEPLQSLHKSLARLAQALMPPSAPSPAHLERPEPERSKQSPADSFEREM